jgi:hypothetical protein
MTKSKNMIRSQKNKNNKTKPENLMKKQYLESYEELKQSIKDQQIGQVISKKVNQETFSL